MDDFVLVSRSNDSPPQKVGLKEGFLALDDLERTFCVVVEGVKFKEARGYTITIEPENRMILPIGGTGQAGHYVLVSKSKHHSQKITRQEQCKFNF